MGDFENPRGVCVRISWRNSMYSGERAICFRFFRFFRKKSKHFGTSKIENSKISKIFENPKSFRKNRWFFFIDRSKISLRFECAHLEGPTNALGGATCPQVTQKKKGYFFKYLHFFRVWAPWICSTVKPKHSYRETRKENQEECRAGCRIVPRAVLLESCLAWLKRDEKSSILSGNTSYVWCFAFRHNVMLIRFLSTQGRSLNTGNELHTNMLMKCDG